MARAHLDGQGLLEYSLLVVLVALVCISAITALGLTAQANLAVPGL